MTAPITINGSDVASAINCVGATFQTDHKFTASHASADVHYANTTVDGQGTLEVTGANGTGTLSGSLGASNSRLKEIFLNSGGGTFGINNTGNGAYANTLRITNTTATFTGGTHSFDTLALTTASPIFKNATLTLTGDVTGSGTVILRGNGGGTLTATLGKGSSTADWNGSALQIDSSLSAGTVNASLAGNLTGIDGLSFNDTGTRTLDLRQYRATITNSITLSINADTIATTITSATGQTTCAGGNTAGCISVGASANIPTQSLVKVTVANGIKPAVGTRYTLIDAPPGGGGVTTLTAGNITSLTSGYTFGQVASTEDLIIDVLTAPAAFSSNPTASVGVTGGVAAVLSQTSGLSASLNTIVNTISGYSAAAQTNALRRLVPMTSTAGFSAVRRAGLAAFDTIGSRLTGLRDAGVFAYDDPFAQGKVLLAAAGPVSGLFPPRDAPRNGAWIRLMGGRADQNAYDGFSGYDAKSRGLTIGFDHRLKNDAVVGIAGTHITTDVNYNDALSGNRNDVRNSQLTAYAGQDFGDFTLDGQLSYASQRYASRRDTAVSGVATANYSGRQAALRVSGGLPIALAGKNTLTAVASLDWMRLTQDGYAETGAGAANLTVPGTSSTRLRSGLGARLSGEIAAGDSTIRPMAHLIWHHDFKKSGVDMSASLEGGGGSFVTPGQEIKRDAANIGVGAMVSTGRHSSISLRLEGELASGYRALNAEAVAQWRF